MSGDNATFHLLTPRGPGGVAVVAVRGPGRWQQACSHLRDRQGQALPADLPPSQVPRLVLLWLADQAMDEVLLLDRPEQQQLELHLHGSPAVLQALQAEVGPYVEEARDAATDLLLRAQDQAQMDLALEQREVDWEAYLQGVLALPLVRRQSELKAAWQRSGRAMALAQPIPLVICGRQNAGKSTLMNRLVMQERVLTGELPGLTRDPVRESCILDGYPYLLVDTAGEGPAHSTVDQAAQAAARQLRTHGLRLLVVDGSKGPAATDRELCQPETLWLRNKMDLPQADWPDELQPLVELFCQQEGSAASIRTQVGQALRRLRGLPIAGAVGGPAVLDQSQLESLRQAMTESALAPE